jgi:predicted nucleic acid-binding protein
VTLSTARMAGTIDGHARERGIVIPCADLWTGITALEPGFAVATANVRHFRLIPNLTLRLIE